MSLLPLGLDFDAMLGHLGVILEAFGGQKGIPELKKVAPGSNFLIRVFTIGFRTICGALLGRCLSHF